MLDTLVHLEALGHITAKLMQHVWPGMQKLLVQVGKTSIWDIDVTGISPKRLRQPRQIS
jgi:hypothetical protein